MNTNIAIVIGFDADGEPHGLYVGRDYEKALGLLESHPEGIHYVAFYRNVTPTRRRQTEESVLIEQKRQEDAEARAAKQREDAAAEVAAKAALEKAEREAAVARAQAKAAAEEKSSNAKKLAEQAETLERIAAEARAKAETAARAVTPPSPDSGAASTGELNRPATVLTQANAAPAGSDSSGAPGETLDPSEPATAATGDDQTGQTNLTEPPKGGTPTRRRR